MSDALATGLAETAEQNLQFSSRQAIGFTKVNPETKAPREAEMINLNFALAAQ